MTAELAQETARVNRLVERTLRQATVVEEVPLRLHSRDVDSGGAPELHPAFLRWLGDRTVCHCGRPAQCAPGCRATRPDEHLSACEPACPSETTRFHASAHRNNPNRLKRALRQVRKLNPKAYDLLYLVAGRGYTWSDATARINAGNLARGLPEHSDAEFAVLWVSGASMMVSAF